MNRRGVIIHAGDAESCELAERALRALRRQGGWTVRRIDRSRTRSFKDTLLVAASGCWYNCRLVEVNQKGEPIGQPIEIKLKRELRPVDSPGARRSD